MGLFGSKGKPSKRRGGGTTIIATGTTLTGELAPEGNVHIDGRIEGQIESANDVSIGADGSFEGEIRAHRMVVSGFARGRIECDSLEIVDKGRVLGEVSSRSFVIEPGGQFVGESRSTDEEAIAQLSHWKGHNTAQQEQPAPAPEPAAPEPPAEPEAESGMEPALDAEAGDVTADEPVVAGIDEEVSAAEGDRDAREPTIPVDHNEPETRDNWATGQQRRWR